MKKEQESTDKVKAAKDRLDKRYNETQKAEREEHLKMIRAEIVSHVDSLLNAHMERIKKAMEDHNDKISVAFKVSLEGMDPLDVETTLSFTPEKVSEHLARKISFDQPNLV